MADTTNARLSREQTQRVADTIHEDYDDKFQENDLLSTKDIPAREGYVQRWVRTSMRGHEDQSNVFKKMNKGWRPRPKSSVPKGQFVMSVGFQGEDVIGIHGMILMERPLSFALRERRSVEHATNLQIDAVQQNIFRMHEPGRGVSRPQMNIESKVSRGRKPDFDD